MSEYFRALCPMAKLCYLEKLSLLGLKESGDPYATSNVDKFVVLALCSILYRPPKATQWAWYIRFLHLSAV